MSALRALVSITHIYIYIYICFSENERKLIKEKFSLFFFLIPRTYRWVLQEGNSSNSWPEWMFLMPAFGFAWKLKQRRGGNTNSAFTTFTILPPFSLWNLDVTENSAFCERYTIYICSYWATSAVPLSTYFYLSHSLSLSLSLIFNSFSSY